MKLPVILVAAACTFGSASIVQAEEAAWAPMPERALGQHCAGDDLPCEQSLTNLLPTYQVGLVAWTFTQIWKEHPMRIIIPLTIVWLFIAGILYEDVVRQKKSELAIVLAAVVLGGVVLFLGAVFLAFK